MRLLSTGRVVRASYRAAITSTKSQRSYSANAAASAEPEESHGPLIKRLTKGFNPQTFRSKDIHPPVDRAPSSPDDPFKAFLVETNDPNKIITKGEASGLVICSKPHRLDEHSNLSPSILKLIDRRLYIKPGHPINTTRKLIESVFSQPDFQHYTACDPVVSTSANFDVLGFPQDHPGRSKTDTYYVNKLRVLRTHTSAHQHAAFENMQPPNAPNGYTICADVFRRDSIDRSHFPVFHQMEGARLWRLPRRGKGGLPISLFDAVGERRNVIIGGLKKLVHSAVDINVEDQNPAFEPLRNPKQAEHGDQDVRLVAAHLKRSLEMLVTKVFDEARKAGIVAGHLKPEVREEPLQVRWIEAYFPFTSPSWELEVFWQGEWLELLGCGIVQQTILNKAGLENRIGWAWGLGVERLAMLLFGIPDIRLFWSEDPRFLSQFKDGRITRYEPFSKYPACHKDVAFWIDSDMPSVAVAVGPDTPPTDYTEPGAAPAGGDMTKAVPAHTSRPPILYANDVMELVRDVAGPLVEDVKLVDEFAHPKTGRRSQCYRIIYRSLERTLTNEETNRLHAEICRRLEAEAGVELR